MYCCLFGCILVQRRCSEIMLLHPRLSVFITQPTPLGSYSFLKSVRGLPPKLYENARNMSILCDRPEHVARVQGTSCENTSSYRVCCVRKTTRKQINK